MTVLSDRAHLLLNAAVFQVTWFGCVLGGAAEQSGWGALALVALLALAATRGRLQADLSLMLVLGVLGFGLDSLWIGMGVLDYGGQSFAPVWVVLLWLGLALTVNHSLAWLRGRPALAAVLAAVSAPLTYLAGERLGAVQVPSTAGLALVSAAWAAVFAVLFLRAPLAAANGLTGGARD